jgi:hypothetical protein
MEKCMNLFQNPAGNGKLHIETKYDMFLYGIVPDGKG